MNDRLINATGPIPYGLTNDCMFHFVFQKDIKALKSLVCSVLHLEPADVNEIEVCNPIEIGHAFDSKKFHLDLKVKFNNNTIVNLLHVVTNSGVDELMIARLAIAQSISCTIVIVYYLIWVRRTGKVAFSCK